MSYQPPHGILLRAAQAGDRIDFAVPSELAEIGELAATMAQPTFVPFGIIRAEDPNLDPTFGKFRDLWIVPAIQQRLSAGETLIGLEAVNEILIVFPPKDAPERHRVLFNEEVVVKAAITPAYDDGKFADAEVGERIEVRLGHMFDLRGFSIEGLDMESDGFVWMRPERGGWAAYFNFIPTTDLSPAVSGASHREFIGSIRDAIAQEILQGLMRPALPEDLAIRNRMAADGWCPTPILLPEPWQQMCDAYARNDPKHAEAAAVAAVGAEHLAMMVRTWVKHEPFASDKAFLELGIRHYLAADYISAISVLLPRIEGLANRVRERRGLDSSIKTSTVFSSLDRLATDTLRGGSLATRLREDFESLIGKFLLTHFHPSSANAHEAKGRHAQAHGATGAGQYTQVYALQIILALDALYFSSR